MCAHVQGVILTIYVYMLYICVGALGEQYKVICNIMRILFTTCYDFSIFDCPI